MESERLNSLIKKFLSKTATQAETQELNNWYREKNERDVIWEHESSGEEKIVKNRIYQKILQETSPNITDFQASWKRRIFYISAAVACAVLIYSISTYIVRLKKPDFSETILAAKQQLENRFVLLPDSSKVILRPGSEISYKYSANERVVTLKGEAFFEVTHNRKKPFLVHAGALTTKVLGTSFNIAAYSANDVVVSVSTGRVSVQDKQKKTLFVLKPDEQIRYQPIQPTIQAQRVETKELTSWVKQDMQFAEIPFGELIESLNRRYHTNIEFQNENMKNCLITGAFDGTESLENVLAVLTKLSGGSYTKQKDKIVLSGEGCIK